MKNILPGLLCISLVILSCGKNDNTCNLNDSTVIASASEVTALEAYLTTAGVTGALKHGSGFYYKITQVGTGKAISNLCSVISVKYSGRLTNGTYFDPVGGGTSTGTFTLGGVVDGWQKGIPLISTGGKITLYIPPSLGYGSTPPAGSGIPANAILIFDVELVSVN